MTSLQATVIITTRNRKDELRKSVASALSQTVRPEVLVIDDGSTDGTFESVKREFPEVTVKRSEHSMGLIVQRNRAAPLAETPIIFSIDDDAVLSSPTVLESTLQEFDHPRVGAVSIPVLDVNRSPEVHHQAPGSRGCFAIYDYVGTAHALRRDIFLALDGYREVLFHQGEEEDYCIRMLNAGFITRAGRSEPIHHFESPRRTWERMDYFGARNKVLYAWHNVPFPYLPVHLAVTTIFTTTYSRNAKRFLTRIRGVLNAYNLISSFRARRKPVSGSVYKLSQELKRRGPLPLGEIEERLPRLPLVHSSAEGFLYGFQQSDARRSL